MLEKLNHYLVRVGILLITAALIAGMAGCCGPEYTPPPSQNLEIRTWYDLDNVRNNIAGNHTLMNDLDSTTPGYEELASPRANEGKGWDPISLYYQGVFRGFAGTFDGQGYEIRDLFINRPDKYVVGLFRSSYGIIKNIGVVNATVVGFYMVGGLVGQNEGGSVNNCYATANVTGDHDVGGLVGESWGNVSNSYATGSVTGNATVGGLVGESWVGTVNNSYATGNVTGNPEVGGLVGLNGGNVSNSYSTGSVTGTSSVGGLVGDNVGTVSNSFWDTETSGQDTSDGGTGKNTTEMQYIVTFSGASWNIIAVALNETNPAYIWNIVDNVTYPFLSWQLV